MKLNKKNIILYSIVFLSINFRRLDELLSLPGGLESRIYLFVSIIVLIFALTSRLQFYVQRIPILLLSSWLIWALLSTVLTSSNVSFNLFWPEFRNAFLSLITFINVLLLLDKDNFASAVKVFGWSVCFQVIITILNVGYFDLGSRSRLNDNTLGLNTNDLAYLLVLTFCLLFLLFDAVNTKTLIGLMAAILLLIILLASRKAFISIVVFGFLYTIISVLFLRKPRVKNLLLLGGVSLVVIIGIGLVQRNTFLGERLNRTKSLQQFEQNEYQRAEHYKLFGKLVKDYPITGVGLGNFISYSKYHKGSHSDYISIFTETGLIGGVLYFGVYLLLLRKVVAMARMRSKSSRISFLLSCLAVLLFYSLGRWNYSTPAHFTFIALLFTIDIYEEN